MTASTSSAEADRPVQTELNEFETTVVVSGVNEIADDVVEISLSRTDGADLPAWTPGAHIDLLLPNPDGEEPLVRQYSLCGPLADRQTYQVAVLRAPDSRGGSTAVHGLTKGSELRIRGPRNHFPLKGSAKYLFIAGGIGITPMLPMIETAQAAGADWHLHYGGRTTASMAYRDRLAPYDGRVTLVPQDTEGLIDLGSLLGTVQPDTLVYCCGPEPLLAAVEAGCESWPKGALNLERFAAKESTSQGTDTAFEVVLQRSGTTITVEPDATVLDAMRGAGVSVLASCMEGICGTCETGVLDGEVDHRDSVLDTDEQEANDCMMVCVSRALSQRLVLDA